jgi:exopolyphosphatase/guanosine-5'-triphosphate,3'-diphosphate pyrophosphatase
MKNKLAAIDIGTNSFHLVVVELSENGKFSIIDSEKEVIRLSEGSVGDIKIIQEESILRSINALQKFAGIAKSHNAEIKAVATSAVRESQNKIDFLKRVFHATGIKIDVISGIEEGRLIYLGVLQSVPIFNKRVLCIDIGGGSTEFVIGFRGKILYADSLKLGAVRLTKMFFKDYKVSKASINNCSKWTEGVLSPIARLISNYKIDLVVGSSGTIMAAGQMIKALEDNNTSLSILNNYIFTKANLIMIKNNILAKKTVEQRKKIKGLDEKRADIIPAGIILLNTIFEQLKISQMTISGYALREGIILDSLAKELPSKELNLTNNIRKESVQKLARSSNYDYKHCCHVAKLSEIIYDQLCELHELNEHHKEYLSVAAILHDIGFHIAHSKHHKHSQYIIVNSELLGYNENEIRTIACVARYHRKSHPKSSHDEYIMLPKDWRVKVNKLAAILRIADAFDRTHNSLVNSIKVTYNKKNVFFTVENDLSEIEIELWSVDRKKQLFEEVFGKKIGVKGNI